jgi:hypothetical protein
MIVLLVVIGFMFRPAWPWASSLTPAQRAELSRLPGSFEGIPSSENAFASQLAVDWRVRFYLNDANKLKCECAPAFYQRNTTSVVFTETVNVHYHDSKLPGYIEIANSGQGRRWKIYVESSVLKSGKPITSVMLYDDDFGQCILQRH